MYVIDENGNKYKSLWAAGKVYGFSAGGHSIERLKRTGHCNCHGYHFRLILEDGDVDGKKVIVQRDPIVERLRQRYSDSEIEAIARGEGIERRRIDFPEIRLSGKHHKFVVISDTHIGSVYSPMEWHEVVSNYVKKSGAEAVLHCGDLVEGMKISRIGTQMYELSDLGYEAQRDSAVRALSLYDVPVYIISGNHDFYYQE